jgi:hypothetical protein
MVRWLFGVLVAPSEPRYRDRAMLIVAVVVPTSVHFNATASLGRRPLRKSRKTKE